MRIAYIANYQGPGLVKSRPCLHNLSLAARVKIQLIAELLVRNSHEVDIISQGSLEPLEPGQWWRSQIYPAIESDAFHPGVRVQYASAISMRFLTGLWESRQCRRILRSNHRRAPYDAIILYNMQRGQIGCFQFARHHGLPIILQYEDDAFVDIYGVKESGLQSRFHKQAYRRVLDTVSAGMAVSPYLLDQFPRDTPKLLLRGVVSNEIVKLLNQGHGEKKNWAVFSGTHEKTQGLTQMVSAWRALNQPDWELHIAGAGPLTATMQQMAAGCPSIVFHGLLDRQENARLLCAARIGLNPQDTTRTPGNVFPFKIVEYLAAGTHVVTTPRGSMEHELDEGVTYIGGNTPEDIAAGLRQVITEHRFERTAVEAALQTYGPDAISSKLNRLLEQGSLRTTRDRCRDGLRSEPRWSDKGL